jgi:hypothetical protein
MRLETRTKPSKTCSISIPNSKEKICRTKPKVLRQKSPKRYHNMQPEAEFQQNRTLSTPGTPVSITQEQEAPTDVLKAEIMKALIVSMPNAWDLLKHGNKSDNPVEDTLRVSPGIFREWPRTNHKQKVHHCLQAPPRTALDCQYFTKVKAPYMLIMLLVLDVSRLVYLIRIILELRH